MAWNKAIASAYVRHRVREALGPSPVHGAVAELARRVGVKPQTISQLVGETRGVGPENFDKFAEFWGLSHDALMARASAWWNEHPEAHPGTRIDYDPGEARAPAFGLLPGWADAEAAARATWKGRAIPEEAWKLAREAAGALTPAQVTPIFVLGLAEAFAEAVATKGEK